MEWFLINLGGNRFVPVKRLAIRLDGFEFFWFFVHQHLLNNKWGVSEQSTGRSITQGCKSRRDAIREAQNYMSVCGTRQLRAQLDNTIMTYRKRAGIK